MGTEIVPRPRVLHLLSDWKWTGPAEPIVNLCRHLRRLGLVADLACARAPASYPISLERRARERRVEPVLDFHLKKGANPFYNLGDIKRLTEYIDREEVQIIHVHTGHDHYIGSRAARKANNQPYVVRTNHRGDPVPPTLLNRWVIGGHTDAWVALSQACLDEDMKNFHIDPSYGLCIEGCVDRERYDADMKYADVRPDLGLTQEHVVAGVVARMQKHRRFDVLLRAFAEAMAQEPTLRALFLGRGTHVDTVVRQPALALGLAEKVILPGYRADDYADYLAAIDFKIFLVPGSEGSCRAAREAMALGIPVLASRRGLLPDLVEDGRCGLVIDDTHENLVKAILRLARDKALRERLGRNAAQKAREHFNMDDQAEAIAGLYARLAERL